MCTPLNLGIKSNDPQFLALKTITNIVSKANLELGWIVGNIFEYEVSILDMLLNYGSAFSKKDEVIDLNLSLKNFSTIRSIRDEALKDKILVRKDNDEVNGSINYAGKSIPVKVRLKGDWYDHLIGEKWSFRINTRKETSFLGMKEFSLQHPRTRGYLNEFIYHSLLKYEGLPFLRYMFLSLRLNGKHLGTYALEESFDKNFESLTIEGYPRPLRMYLRATRGGSA